MRSQYQALTAVAVVSLIAACSSGEDVTSTQPYSAVVGSEYRVVGDVAAYGIYEDLNNRQSVSFVELVPGVGFSGPEVAFKTTVPKGETLRIVGARRSAGFLSSDVYYVAELRNKALLKQAQVQIELSRGNEGPEGMLNPAIYEKTGS